MGFNHDSLVKREPITLKKSMLKLIDKLKNRNIMVIGDMVADVYWEGKISRISREAPVLILEHASEKVVPGGAANAVYNTASLGGSVYAVGVVGQDFAGEQLGNMLHNKGVHVDGLVLATQRPTITKTRIMAGGNATVRQQVVRIDKQDNSPLPLAVEQELLAYLAAHIDKMDAVVMSDYGNQTISPQIISFVTAQCRHKGIPCIVDSRYHIMSYRGVGIVKQNEFEALSAVAFPHTQGDITDEAVIDAGKTILDALSAEAVLITRGPDGMTLVEKGNVVTHIPVTNISEVYDVTGAGDTVVAAMTLALAAGASYVDAARLANFTAGVVVRKPGTAVVAPEELKKAIEEHEA